MTKRNFPHIRLTSQSMRGNYYGAYENNDENTKYGYTVFVSNTKDTHDYCECAAFVHNKPCYHLIRAKELEILYFNTNMEKINA